jgi:Undecaprenyl-phosphate glucose phosphotransferase
VGLADGLSVIGTGLVIFLIQVGWGSESNQLYFSAIAIAALLTIAAFSATDMYKFEHITHAMGGLKRIVLVCGVIFLILVALAFAMKISEQYSRMWVFSWLVSAAFLICLQRACWELMIRKSALAGRLTRNIVIVGAGEQASRLLERLDKVREPWNRVIGIFDDRVDRIDPESLNYAIAGNVSHLLDFARENRVDNIAVTLPWNAEQRVGEIVSRLTELPADVLLAPDLIGFTYRNEGYSSLGGVPLLNLVTKPLAGWKVVVKYLEDRILAVTMLILLAPFMLLIALAIKLDSKGPVLFRQPRYGFNNRVFSVFKFRTMVHNDVSDDGVPQAKRNDPRVTRVGRLLRRKSLDELPQLFNVLQGTMSLVGPRPHAVPHNEEYAAIIRGYFARHRVKPGITGWAQVNGFRGGTTNPEKMKARIEHDIYYIEHWSLLFDLVVLAVTPFVIWRQKNAY